MIYAKVLQSDERRCALSRLSKITHEFLTATGLPYAVSDAPPLKRFGPTGLRVSYDVEWVEFYYPHQREWWKFDTALDDNVTLEPERSMFTKTTDWPLTLPLWILSDLIEGCRSSLYPRDPRLIADLEDASPEEIAVVEDLQEQGSPAVTAHYRWSNAPQHQGRHAVGNTATPATHDPGRRYVWARCEAHGVTVVALPRCAVGCAELPRLGQDLCYRRPRA